MALIGLWINKTSEQKKRSMFNLDRQSNTKHKTKKSLNIKNVHQTINYYNNECLAIENVAHLARKRPFAVAPNEQ